MSDVDVIAHVYVVHMRDGRELVGRLQGSGGNLRGHRRMRQHMDGILLRGWSLFVWTDEGHKLFSKRLTKVLISTVSHVDCDGETIWAPQKEQE